MTRRNATVAAGTLGCPRGVLVRAALYLVWELGGATARVVAGALGVPSRWVYSLLKWWIRRGVVTVTKVGRFNLYRVAEPLASMSEREVLEWLGFSSREELLRAARAAARRLLAEELGGEPSDVEEAVVAAALRAHLSGRRLLEYSDPERLRRDVSREAGREVDYSELWAAIMRLRNAGVLAAPGPRKARRMRSFWMRLTSSFLGELAGRVPALEKLLREAGLLE